MQEYGYYASGSIAKAAVQPCLSYCTQVANTCANRPDWIMLCAGLVCRAESEVPCEPGPTEETGEPCNKYVITSFYSAGAKVGLRRDGAWIATAAAGVMGLGLVLF